MDYKERLVMEYEELTIRIAKLQCYLENNSTHDEKTELMEKQIEVMFGYKEILQRRILLEMK